MFLKNKWFYTPYPESDHNASVVQPTAWSTVSYMTGSGHVSPQSNAKGKNQWNYTSTPTICLCGRAGTLLYYARVYKTKLLKECLFTLIMYLKNLSMGNGTLLYGACRLTRIYKLATELTVRYETDYNCRSAVSATIQSTYFLTTRHR